MTLSLCKQHLADDWDSVPNAYAPGKPGPGAEGFYKLATGFFLKAVPSFKWSTEEYLHIKCDNGDTYVHIGTATGRPVEPFFGVDPPTNKAFNILAIDIHHVEDGKLRNSWHVEEWLT